MFLRCVVLFLTRSALQGLKPLTMTHLLQPFVALVAETHDITTVQRTIDNIWDSLLDCVTGERDTALPLDAESIARALFDAGGDPCVLGSAPVSV
jgi:hypothetical protein